MQQKHPLVASTAIDGMTPKSGKVRDVYDFGDHVLLVGTDRISAFDWILPSLIPDKGCVLTQTAAFWFETLGVPHHLVTTDVAKMPLPPGTDPALFAGRSSWCRKTKVFPIECIVRGYLAGSGWKEYQQTGAISGIKLASGLRESERLEEPIFTPSTKAETGHDENISFDEMANLIGLEAAQTLRDRSIDVFKRGRDYALERGIIIADTKFEFGTLGDEIVLVDEVMTPDSSRFWPLSQYVAGQSQPSFDKQFVRDWLLASSWDRVSTPPALPQDIVEKTHDKYVEAFTRLTGRELQ